MDIHHFFADLAKITITLFIVLDPIGLIPVLYTATARLSSAASRRLIYRVSGATTLLLLFFTVTGTWVLGFFGVTLNDLRISGGILLAIIAVQMVISGDTDTDDESKKHELGEGPLISPLLIGPGAITAAIVLGANYGILMTSLGAIVAMIISLLVFLSTRFLHRLIGDRGTDLIRRIVGTLIAAVGVSYIRIGIISLLNQPK